MVSSLLVAVWGANRYVGASVRRALCLAINAVFLAYTRNEFGTRLRPCFLTYIVHIHVIATKPERHVRTGRGKHVVYLDLTEARTGSHDGGTAPAGQPTLPVNRRLESTSRRDDDKTIFLL